MIGKGYHVLRIPAGSSPIISDTVYLSIYLHIMSDIPPWLKADADQIFLMADADLPPWRKADVDELDDADQMQADADEMAARQERLDAFHKRCEEKARLRAAAAAAAGSSSGQKQKTGVIAEPLAGTGNEETQKPKSKKMPRKK